MTDQPLPPPEILLEQGAVMLLHKPGGLLTQGPPGIDSLELRTKRFLKTRDQKPGKVYLGVPHRLDRPVSGVMCVVKNVRAAKRISDQLVARTVKKVYWAMVEGNVAANSGIWEDAMRKLPDQAKSEIVSNDHPDAKWARLAFEVIDRFLSPQSKQPLSLLQIELDTGRTHQIRLQAASRRFPIVGDTLYGAQELFGPQTTDLRQRWIALHARRLAFEHPIEHVQLDQLAPLPDPWRPFASADSSASRFLLNQIQEGG